MDREELRARVKKVHPAACAADILPPDEGEARPVKVTPHREPLMQKQVGDHTTLTQPEVRSARKPSDVQFKPKVGLSLMINRGVNSQN